MGGRPPIIFAKGRVCVREQAVVHSQHRAQESSFTTETQRTRRSEFVSCGEAATAPDATIAASPPNARIFLRALRVSVVNLLLRRPKLASDWVWIGFAEGSDR